MSQQPLSNGNGVIVSNQVLKAAPHISGEVTPPQPITPLYAQPQPHRILTVSPEKQQQMYQPFNNMDKNMTFGPIQSNEKWSQENAVK